MNEQRAWQNSAKKNGGRFSVPPFFFRSGPSISLIVDALRPKEYRCRTLLPHFSRRSPRRTEDVPGLDNDTPPALPVTAVVFPSNTEPQYTFSPRYSCAPCAAGRGRIDLGQCFCRRGPRSNICFAAARPEQITRLKRSKRTSTHAIEMFCTPPGAIMKYIGDGGASAPPPRKRAASADTAGMWGGMRFAGISSVPEFRQRTGGPNFLRKTTKALEPKGVQGL